MQNWFDCEVEQLNNGMVGKIKKPTRIRRNSPLVFDALNLLVSM